MTNNSSNDRFPALSGSELAWYRDYQLFFWSASTGVTTLITATGVDANCKLAVSGSNVVWRGHDGNDYEIFLALPEPAAAFQRVLALGVIALFAQRLRVRQPRDR